MNISQIKTLRRNMCKLMGHDYKYEKSPLPIPRDTHTLRIGVCKRCFLRMTVTMDWFNTGDMPTYDQDFPEERM